MIRQQRTKVFVANLILSLEFPKEATKQQWELISKSSEVMGTLSYKATCLSTPVMSSLNTNFQNYTIYIHKQMT